jgi:hypothetical protein
MDAGRRETATLDWAVVDWTIVDLAVANGRVVDSSIRLPGCRVWMPVGGCNVDETAQLYEGWPSRSLTRARGISPPRPSRPMSHILP